VKDPKTPLVEWRIDAWAGALIMLWAVAVILILAFGAHADSGLQIAPGSQWPVYTPVTVGTTCGVVISANPNNRIDVVLCNDGSNKAYCAGSGASSTQGSPIATGACATLPYSGAVTCCASTGTTTMQPGEILR